MCDFLTGFDKDQENKLYLFGQNKIFSTLICKIKLYNKYDYIKNNNLLGYQAKTHATGLSVHKTKFNNSIERGSAILSFNL